MHIAYDADSDEFTIATSAVIPQISAWVGWRRLPNGGYRARAWAASALAVDERIVPWSKTAKAKRDDLLRQLQLAREAIGGGALPLVSKGAFPTPRQPRRHQFQGVIAMRSLGWRWIVGDEMGLGKTSTALWGLHDSAATRLLVVCPVSVKFNWRDEIGDTLGTLWTTFVVDGTPKQRADQIPEALACAITKPTALIINYDLLRHLTVAQVEDLKLFVKDQFAIFDESHYVKGRTSERTKLSLEIAAPAKHVLALTGTPQRNLADDLYTQVELVRPGTWTSYRDFANRHLVITSLQFPNHKKPVQKIVGVKNVDALNAVMNTLQIRRKKADVLDLPPKVYTRPQLVLDGDHAKFYKAMKDFARVELKALMHTRDAHLGPLSSGVKMNIFDPRARSAVEQAMRCEQIAQGFCGGIPDKIMQQLGASILKGAEKIPGRSNELVFPGSPKLVWLLEAIESVLAQGGAPAVITRFNAPAFWLEAELAKRSIKARFMHGNLDGSVRHELIQGFRDKHFDVLITQVKIAEGWNATRCQDVLFLGRDWSPAVNAQAEDRFHRMGQKGTVNIQIPIVQRTIETMIDRVLSAKDADAQQALRNVTIDELLEAL